MPFALASYDPLLRMYLCNERFTHPIISAMSAELFWLQWNKSKCVKHPSIKYIHSWSLGMYTKRVSSDSDLSQRFLRPEPTWVLSNVTITSMFLLGSISLDDQTSHLLRSRTSDNITVFSMSYLLKNNPIRLRTCLEYLPMELSSRITTILWYYSHWLNIR